MCVCVCVSLLNNLLSITYPRQGYLTYLWIDALLLRGSVLAFCLAVAEWGPALGVPLWIIARTLQLCRGHAGAQAQHVGHATKV